MTTEDDTLVKDDSLIGSLLLCRICMNEDIKNTISLFEAHKNCLLSETLMICGQIDVHRDDGLPSVICDKCFDDLNAANVFRKKCQKSDALLRKIFNNDNLKKVSEFRESLGILTEVKEEPVDGNAGAIVLDFLKKEDESNDDDKYSVDLNNDLDLSENNENNKDVIRRKSKHKKDRGTSSRKVSCPQCCKPLSSKYSLEKHLHNVHSETKQRKYGVKTGFGANSRFHCTECNYVTNRTQSLQYHMYTHTGERPYKCEECGKCFSQHSTLANHMKGHSDKTFFSCEHCGKQFKTKRKHEKHKLVHQDGQFKCTLCGKAVKSKENLESHMKRHYNIRNFSCDICGSTFVTRCGLLNHTSIHKDKFYECQLCQYKSRRKHALKVHMMRHAGVHPFQCDSCEKSFTTRGALVSHIVKHTKEQKYSCPECGDKFRHSSSVNKHMLRKHGIKFSRNAITDRRIIK